MLKTLTDHKESIASFFDRASQRGYGNLSYFPVFGERLVNAGRVKRGASVLDVACGRGAVLFHAAARAGDIGKVIGIDLSDEMVNQTNAVLLERGMNKAIVFRMDSEHLEFPDSSFDVVFCGFALFFFSNLPRALSEFRRVLKPGGTLAVTTWSAATDPAWTWYEEHRAAYGATLKLTNQLLDTPEDIHRALSGAGFVDVHTQIEEYDWVVPNEETWWEAMWSISPGAALEKLEPHIVEQFKTEAFEKMRPMKRADGFHRTLQVNLATCIKPEREERAGE
jgi:ubiquinone/menaquinone biosynthesis C-methylase UbiE